MRNLEIAHFSEVARPLMNGVVVAVEQLMRAQILRGHRASLITPALGDKRPGWREEEHAFRIDSLPLPTSTGYRLAWPFGNYSAIRRNVGRVDILHAHSLFLMGSVAQHIAGSKKVPCLYTYHTNLDHYFHYAGVASGVTRFLMQDRVKSFSDQLDLLIAPTHVIANMLTSHGVSVPMAVVPSGIDTAKFALPKQPRFLRDRLGLADETVILLCVARLAREKNVESLVAMMRYLDDHHHLVLIGQGSLRRHLQAHIARHGLQHRIHLLGEVPQDHIPAYYAGADLFVFPSMSETQGLVLCEAMASGLPIVAVDTPVHQELIGATDAFLVPNEPNAMAVAVKISQEREAWSLERSLQRQRFAQGFAAERSAARIEELYHEVLAKTSRWAVRLNRV